MTTPALPRHRRLQALTFDPRTAQVSQDGSTTLPTDITAWLSDLQRLIGVPFHYLVPDARMLPAESIRFFTVDPNWIAAMIDGALSVGAGSAPHAAAISALRPTMLAATGTDPGIPCSGFLLRSAIVADWPGLRISGYAAGDGTGEPLAIARLERVAPTVLIALFSGLVRRVDLAEPAQHLHFGVASESAPSIALRWIDPARAGQQLANDPSVATVMRPGPNRTVLDVVGTVAAISAGLTAPYAPDPVPHLGSAALALQMAIGVQAQSFRIGTTEALLINGSAGAIDTYVIGALGPAGLQPGAITRLGVWGSPPSLETFRAVRDPSGSSAGRTDTPALTVNPLALPGGPLPAVLLTEATGTANGLTMTTIAGNPAPVAPTDGRVTVAVVHGGPAVDLAVDGTAALTGVAPGSANDITVPAGVHSFVVQAAGSQWSAQLRIPGASSTRLYVLGAAGAVLQVIRITVPATPRAAATATG